MNTRKILLAVATASLTLLAAACNNNDDGASFTGPMTLKDFAVNDINLRTLDGAAPIEINDLTIDDSNEDAAQYDDILQST